MGFIDFKDEPHHKDYLRKVLTKKGLKPIFTSEWEIHGPHQDMDYQIYVGEARYIKTGIHIIVSINPDSIYEVDDYSDWWKIGPENEL